jgi:hypothetical protein
LHKVTPARILADESHEPVMRESLGPPRKIADHGEDALARGLDENGIAAVQKG